MTANFDYALCLKFIKAHRAVVFSVDATCQYCRYLPELCDLVNWRMVYEKITV